jgi:hypothetical protein
MPETPQDVSAWLSTVRSGVVITRQSLRRRMPGASESAIRDALNAWLHERPGAEHGDAVGLPVAPPHTRA